MRALFVAIGLAVAAPARAHADGEPGRHPLTLPAEQLQLDTSLEVDLPRGALNGVVAIAPSVWYGLTDDWTLGVTHGHASLDRIAAGAGFCIADDCKQRYSDGAVDVRRRVRTGALSVAPRARFVMRDFDPAKPAVTAGALLRWQRGRFTITSDPYLRIGLAHRDQGNRDVLMLPLWLGVHPGRSWLLELHTGYDSELVNAGDGYHIPVAVAVTARAAASLELRVEIGFASLLGPQSDYKALAALVTLQRRWALRLTAR